MMRTAIISVTLSMLIVVSAPSSWAATPLLSIDSGFIQRVWSVVSKPRNDDIVFVWIPSRPLTETEQFLIGECGRRNRFGFPTGGHKVTFKNIVLLGVDSGNIVVAETQSERVRNGVQRDLAEWILTPLTQALFAEDSSVLVSARVKFNKKVNPLDLVTCAMGVVELEGGSAAPSAAARQHVPGGRVPAAHGLGLPRLLKTPRSP